RRRLPAHHHDRLGAGRLPPAVAARAAARLGPGRHLDRFGPLHRAAAGRRPRAGGGGAVAVRLAGGHGMSPRRPDADVPPALLLVDKPAGMTSHDVVARARKALSVRRVGHAGTLDPMATGLLILGVGAATRLLGHVGGHDKTYEATIRFGRTTVTDDAEGDVLATTSAQALTDDDVHA